MCDLPETSLLTQMLQQLTEPVLLSTRYFHEDFLQFSRQPNFVQSTEHCNRHKYFILLVYPITSNCVPHNLGN